MGQFTRNVINYAGGLVVASVVLPLILPSLSHDDLVGMGGSILGSLPLLIFIVGVVVLVVFGVVLDQKTGENPPF